MFKSLHNFNFDSKKDVQQLAKEAIERYVWNLENAEEKKGKIKQKKNVNK